ncbi:RNA polymerase sigma factor [Novosphingobium sp. MBES04]|uniref:RNA polymerase sigma factor n=1 Tax=Novosphingobium sp. MBES04 TaxID=1206458 RepID=UPI000693F844|nr:sigma factor-like helix-turn-helix DNA-binding protein [Novosphingobium sp. MBES04]GAM05570.1 RNA polymerase sigma factor [Novosphingobium sp. MBES04]
MMRRFYQLEQAIREAFLRDAFPEYEDPQVRRVARAVHSLPRFHRQLFCLVRYDCWSYDEIAARFDISVRRVEIEMGRAIAMLGRSLDRQKRKGW